MVSLSRLDHIHLSFFSFLSETGSYVHLAVTLCVGQDTKIQLLMHLDLVYSDSDS